MQEYVLKMCPLVTFVHFGLGLGLGLSGRKDSKYKVLLGFKCRFFSSLQSNVKSYFDVMYTINLTVYINILHNAPLIY